MNSQGIVKRGYLFDKKVGLLPMTVDRKRWYVLRQDPGAQHHAPTRVILEYYKDEKAASKGDTPKGFINIRDVVSVHRVADKKQSFEILCPGIGYRLMANSDLEANEWTSAIRSHICYKRDDAGVLNSDGLTSSMPGPHMREDVVANGMKSLSLTRVHSAGGHLHHHSHLTPPLQDRHRALSDSHHPVTTHLHPSSSFQQPHHQLLQPRAIPIVSAHPHRAHETHSMVHLSHSLPTPPDSFPSPPSYPPFLLPPGFQRQRSLEVAPSLPSPSTSSDSSSMCSGSNTSFEGGGAVFEADGIESKSVFRVQVKETESLTVVGSADLVVNEDGLRLHSIPPDQQELVFWPLGCLRRYGVNNHCFTIITGRFCATGEGKFQFYTEESRVIHAKLHSYATQKAAHSGKSRSLPRRASEPTEFGGRSPQQTTPIHSLNLTQSLPPHVHALQYAQSNDVSHDYCRLQHFLPPGTVHPSGRVYTHSMTQPIPVGQQVVPNQHYMPQGSPTNQMHLHLSPHPPTTTSANYIHSSSSQTKSIPSPDECQNQSLTEAMKSLSSESSIGSGGESVGGASGDSVGGASSGEASSGVTLSRGDVLGGRDLTTSPVSSQEDRPAESALLSDAVR